MAEAPLNPPIEIRVLGELTVRVGGELRSLPRSRKSRALLAYLAITARRHRRDQLCDLFWDVADDRRAALRWSLTKLRKALGDDGRACVVASRDHLELALPRDALDLARLRRITRRGLDEQTTDALEAMAEDCQGELLEGLLLPDFDTFEAWLEAERAEARRLHAKLRRELVARLDDEPERALRHARRWFQRSGATEAQQHVERLTRRLAQGPASEVEPRPTEPAAPAELTAAEPQKPARPLVGRDAEIARLVMIAHEARSQHSARIVLLLGEPGMGKTRLLEELRYRERDPAPFLVSAAFFEAERDRPLAPFLDAMGSALGADPLATDEEAPDRDHLFETIATLLRRGADRHGLGLLLLDDAHLGDPTSCELLHYAIRTAERSPLVTVLTCRPAELADNPELSGALAALRRRHLVEEITLRALDEGALHELIRAAAPSVSPAPVASQSEGNPLIALEMARAGGCDAEVPRTLADLVLGRLGTLPEPTGALVRWASVCVRGSRMMLETLCADDVPDFVNALEAATRYELLRVSTGAQGDGGFEMGHALIQRIVYDSISEVRRAAMHRAVAELLSRRHHHQNRGSVIAYHATRADRPDLAIRALIHGAEGCTAIGAAPEAADLADRALALLDRVPPALALQLELDALVVLAQVRRPPKPAEFVRRLTELGLAALDHDRPRDAHRAFHTASNLRWEAGSSSDGYGLARQAWHASRSGSVEQRVQGSSFMAMCLVLMEKQLPDAQTILQEAEALARSSEGVPEPAELAIARGLLHLHAGRLDEARRDATDARLLARMSKRGLFEAMALQTTVQIEHVDERTAEATAAANELLELSKRIREGGEGALASAVIALGLTDDAERRAALEAALQRLQELDDKRRLAWVANRWARDERRRGDRGEARRLATIALEAARAVAAKSEAAIASSELMVGAALADDDDAYSEAEQALADLEAEGSLSAEARAIVRELTVPTG